jgi:hypothetical protein
MGRLTTPLYLIALALARDSDALTAVVAATFVLDLLFMGFRKADVDAKRH